MANGSVLRQRVLGEAAIYRVLRAHGSLVDAEAVAVPGLRPGTRLRLTAAAASAMHVAPAAERDRIREGIRVPAGRAVRALPRA